MTNKRCRILKDKVSVAILIPATVGGGVKTVARELYVGLVKEGFKVSLVPIPGNSLLKRFVNDLFLNTRLHGYDLKIYLGSFSYLSKFLPGRSQKLLFVHGFVRDEFVRAFLIRIHKRELKHALGLLFLICYDILLNKLNIDRFICHSLTTCQANGIKRDYVLLPQFLHIEEVEYFKNLRNLIHQSQSKQPKGLYFISTYYAPAASKLLSTEYLILVTKKLNAYFEKKGSRIVLRIFGYVPYDVLRCADSPFVEYKGYLPQKEFWEYVASSDIFFERCLDEEIGYAALEAGALGVPIAKVTLLPYVRRMDLTKNEAIIAYNCESLLKELIYYFDNISREKNRLVESFDKYILARRTWDTVKGQLLNVLGL